MIPRTAAPFAEEEIPCALCGSRDITLFLPPSREYARDSSPAPRRRYSSASTDRAHDRIVSCRRCGLVFISPRPAAEAVTGAYRGAIDPLYLSEEEARRATARRLLRLVGRFERPGRILDVGCAAGYFVSTAAVAGWDASGVEPSQWLADLGRDRYGVDLKACTLREARYPGGHFDAVTFWDTLEHMPEPLEELREAHRVMKGGGHLFVSYPNIRCLLVKIFGRRHWWFTPGHLYYFGRDTLSRMARAAGFEPVLHRLHFPRYSLDYLVLRAVPRRRGLHRAIRAILRPPGIGALMIPCYASQAILVARKIGGESPPGR